MRKLRTDSITSVVDLPIKSGSLDHVQLAYQECITAIVNNLLGNKARTTCFILWGCVNSTTAPIFTISAGAIFYQGEIYLVDAVTFTAAGGQTSVGNIVTTQHLTNADPVVFTDSVSRNVHDIRKIVFASATAGTGVVDFTALKNTVVVMKNDQQATLPSSYTVLFDQDRAVFFNSATVNSTFTFDFTDAIPGTVVKLNWTFGAALTLTVNQPAGSHVVKLSGNLASVASANNVMQIEYLGKNSAGNDEVQYTLTQY